MISLSDAQLRFVMAAAHTLPVEKRDLYLQRIAAVLKLRGQFDDADIADAVQHGLRGLVHQPAA